MNTLRTLGIVAFAVALALVAAPAAHAQTFSNTAAINFATSTSDGRATLYPSPIVVSGAPASIGYVSVTLSGFSHTWISDVNVLLVSPTGQKTLLMANTNGSSDANNNTLTFIPDGTATLPSFVGNLVSGVYACSVYSAPAALPTPAPAGPYATSLAPLIGINANGTWNLYVWDDNPTSNNGNFAGGWSITFNRVPALPATTAFTYQGVLTASGTPVVGAANVRFTLCESPTAAINFSGVPPTITRSFTGIEGGLFTTTLDFGTTIDTSRALWLNLEVDSPPGSGFVTLAPRQAITPTPQARVAQRALVADVATNAINATNAANATNASAVAWAGITGVPANVSDAFSPWTPATGGINYASGNVGVGTTSPLYNIDVRSNGDAEIALTGGPALFGAIPPRTWVITSSDVGQFSNPTFSGKFQIRDVTSPINLARLVIDANGNVGIGTAAPLERLHVIGNVRATNVVVPSSGRFKHNVAPMGDALDKLLKLDGVTFDWNADYAKDRPGREHDIGFVAEDVAKVFPEVVFYDAEGKVTGMDYSRLTAVAVSAIKQQQVKFDAELAKRDAENAALKARLAAIEAALLKMNKDQK